MKIYGDESSTRFKTYAREPGIICGCNDILMGDREMNQRITTSCFGITDEWITTQPKLYLHIFNSFWSSVTGIVRKYCLPWRWKTAYLDQENGTLPQPVLVCTSVHDGELSRRLEAVIGQSLFVANLIKANQYEEIFGREYLRIPRQSGRHDNEIIHPLGELAGSQIELNNTGEVCHIHRIRGIFSFFKYYFLKTFSSKWEEVVIQVGQVAEKVLIKRSERATISRAGLVFSTGSQ